MRVLIMSDMEGVSGIVVWNQVTGGDPMFESRAGDWLTAWTSSGPAPERDPFRPTPPATPRRSRRIRPCSA